MWPISRRQFLQMGAVSACGVALASADAWVSSRAAEPQPVQWDPLLHLALDHEFVDHDPGPGAGDSRCMVKLATPDLEAWRRCLRPGDEIQSWFQTDAHVWATARIQPATLRGWRDQGFPAMVVDHVWGAPWSQDLTSTPFGRSAAEPVEESHAWEKSGRKNRHKFLLVDHGFPVEHLRDLNRPFIHRSSRSPTRPLPLRSAHSHGAQVLGLWLEAQAQAQSQGALLLYELPDFILDTMPRGVLGAELMDAVCWAISHCEPHDHLVVLLSIVSTDGDRHAQSFMSQSVRALIDHGLSQRVQISWVFAAGNSHDQAQNLRFSLMPGQSSRWVWRLPPNHLRSFFMECWHDAQWGVPEFRFKAPGAVRWSAHEALSRSSRYHASSGRMQTLFRLPPTASLEPASMLSPPGDWLFECTSERAGDLDVHLSLVSASSTPARQSRLLALPESDAAVLDPVTLSGLVPWHCGAWAAMTLKPDSRQSVVLDPAQDQLASYCGRLPLNATHDAVRCLGVRLSDSLLHPGAKVISRHGHRSHRAEGTSMAVPTTINHLPRPKMT